MNKSYKVALNKLIAETYLWYNVSKNYGNNTYKWKKKTDKDLKTETIPTECMTTQILTKIMTPTKRNTSSGCIFTKHLFVRQF